MTLGNQALGVGSDPGGALDEDGRADIGVGAVGGGHVVLEGRGAVGLVAPRVGGDAVAAQVDLDGGGGSADPSQVGGRPSPTRSGLAPPPGWSRRGGGRPSIRSGAVAGSPSRLVSGRCLTPGLR